MAQKIGRRHQGTAAPPDCWIRRRRSFQHEIVLGRADVERHKEGLRPVVRLDETYIVIRHSVWIGRMAAKAFGDWTIPARSGGRCNKRRDIIADDDIGGGSPLMGCASGSYPCHS